MCWVHPPPPLLDPLLNSPNTALQNCGLNKNKSMSSKLQYMHSGMWAERDNQVVKSNRLVNTVSRQKTLINTVATQWSSSIEHLKALLLQLPEQDIKWQYIQDMAGVENGATLHTGVWCLWNYLIEGSRSKMNYWWWPCSGGSTTGPLGLGPQAPELQGARKFSTNIFLGQHHY